jgi:hypothetical protein
VRRTIALEDAMRHEPLGRALGRHRSRLGRSPLGARSGPVGARIILVAAPLRGRTAKAE